VGTVTIAHSIVAEAGVEAAASAGAGAGAGMPDKSEDATGLWKDGRPLRERGAILHLLPPLMRSGERLLTLLLMKFALGNRQLKIPPAKIWPRRTIKRWVATNDVHDFPNSRPDPPFHFSDRADSLYPRSHHHQHHLILLRCLYHLDLCLS
jgi:hypothetical protein